MTLSETILAINAGCWSFVRTGSRTLRVTGYLIWIPAPNWWLLLNLQRICTVTWPILQTSKKTAFHKNEAIPSFHFIFKHLFFSNSNNDNAYYVITKALQWKRPKNLTPRRDLNRGSGGGCDDHYICYVTRATFHFISYVFKPPFFWKGQSDNQYKVANEIHNCNL
jgi:hypothetical protein